MKNIVKLFALSLSLAVGVVGLAHAAPPNSRVVPMDQRGNPAFPQYGGYLHARNSSTGEQLVCSGRCLLAGIIMSTAVNGSPVQLRIRNTSVAEGSGALVGEYDFYSVQTGPGQANPIVLPILLDKGITSSLSSASNGEEATVLYLDLD